MQPLEKFTPQQLRKHLAETMLKLTNEQITTAAANATAKLAEEIGKSHKTQINGKSLIR